MDKTTRYFLIKKSNSLSAKDGGLLDDEVLDELPRERDELQSPGANTFDSLEPGIDPCYGTEVRGFL